MDASNKLNLGYWNIRGLAHQIRTMMVHLGVEYTDTLYEQGEAPDFDRSCWLSVKPTIGCDFPNLPYLIDGDYKLSESGAIMKYIAAKHDKNLLGRNPQEIGQTEMINNIVMDMKGSVTGPCYGTGDRAAICAVIDTKIEGICKFLGDKKFLVGDQVTYVDFIFFELLEFSNFITEGKLYETRKCCADYRDRMMELKGVRAFMESDYTKGQKFNNKIAKLGN